MNRKFDLSSSSLLLKGVGGAIRSEKLYSAMYICGTALAIAFTMLIAEVYYVKTADIAPEVNRSKTYKLDYMILKNEESRTIIPQWDDFRDLFQKMQTPECITAVMNYWSSGGDYIKLADGRHDRAVNPKVTEPGFFRFFQFRFTEGAPFTQDDFDSGRRNVVITEEILGFHPRSMVAHYHQLHHRLHHLLPVRQREGPLQQLCQPESCRPSLVRRLRHALHGRFPLCLHYYTMYRPHRHHDSCPEDYQHESYRRTEGRIDPFRGNSKFKIY